MSVHTDKTRFKCLTSKPEIFPGLEMGKVKVNGI
jgi:hypothetical protein